MVMSNEGKSLTFTAGGAITAGQLVALHTDDKVYASTHWSADKVVGIALTTVTASDISNGNDKVAVATEGVFTLTDSGSGIAAGTQFEAVDADTIRTVASAKALGTALATISASGTGSCLIRI